MVGVLFCATVCISPTILHDPAAIQFDFFPILHLEDVCFVFSELRNNRRGVYPLYFRVKTFIVLNLKHFVRVNLVRIVFFLCSNYFSNDISCLLCDIENLWFKNNIKFIIDCFFYMIRNFLLLYKFFQ